MYARRLAVAAVLSFGAHLLVARAVERLPHRPAPPYRGPLAVRLVAPPPPPEQPPTAAPPTAAPEVVDPVAVVPELSTTPPPPTPPKARPKPRPKPTTRVAPAAPAGPADRAVVVDAAPGTAPPVFGVRMQSASGAGRLKVGVGNAPAGAPSTGAPAGPAGGGGAPVAAHEVTRMPLPIGRCEGKSTEAARAAGIEGVVVLDLVVDPQGRARDVQVVRGLSHGLDDAAIAAVKSCRFRPGERASQPVAVRIRAFKVRFVQDDRP